MDKQVNLNEQVNLYDDIDQENILKKKECLLLDIIKIRIYCWNWKSKSIITLNQLKYT